MSTYSLAGQRAACSVMQARLERVTEGVRATAPLRKGYLESLTTNARLRALGLELLADGPLAASSPLPP